MYDPRKFGVAKEELPREDCSFFGGGLQTSNVNDFVCSFCCVFDGVFLSQWEIHAIPESVRWPKRNQRYYFEFRARRAFC